MATIETGSERRQWRRRPVRSAFVVSPVPGVIKNMSPTGMELETQEGLTIGRRYQFVIGDDSSNARIPCIVEWCRLARTERTAGGDVVSIFLLGVSFLGCEERPAPARA